MEKNKTIGIISVDINTPQFNYGAILHSWAFLEFLLHNGYNNVECLAYFPKDLENQNRLFPLFDILHGCHPRLSLFYSLHYFQYFKKYKKIKRFAKNEFIFSKKIYKYSTIKKERIPYDLLIAEDDVIWAPHFLCQGELVDKTFFLAWENMCNCRKIAYSPSMANCDYREADVPIIADYLKSFDFISVRENYEKDYLEQKMGIHSKKVLDAVFLLDPGAYSRIISKRFEKGRYVLLYLPAQDNELLRESALAYSRKHGLDLLEISNKIVSKKSVIGNAGVEDFLSAIMYADRVFTNSFHAICFSIIFQKQFYAFSRKASGKIEDICKTFGLSDFYFSESFLPPAHDIDYIEVDKTRARLSDDSRKWLLSAMEAV